MNEEASAELQTPTGDVIDAIGVERDMEMIPHRYPFLMVDRVIDIVPNVSAVGVKNVSINEPQFQGHFPRHPVMPCVLIIEAMAQSAAVLVVQTLGKDFEGKLVYFMSIDSAHLRKPVEPGDVMFVHVAKKRQRGPVWKFEAEAKVDGHVVADAVYSAMILDS
jgi:3-hydroxyacyl-[acyl-carrier-protein] dehydratase